MYIKKKTVTVFYELIIGIISLIAEWYLLGRYGWSALRAFPTWALFLSAVYFLSSALFITVSPKDPGKKPCPMLEGMILMAFILMSGMAIVSSAYSFYLPELDEWIIWLVCAVLPLMILIDWALFTKKGRWRVMYPFYWLAMPIFYASTMIFTANFLPNSAIWRYPLELFDYQTFGLWDALGWIFVVILLDLAIGYILYIIDFALSGKLAHKIVLPHLRTIVVDEKGNEIIETKNKPTQDPKPQPPKTSQPKVAKASSVSAKTTKASFQKPHNSSKPNSSKPHHKKSHQK